MVCFDWNTIAAIASAVAAIAAVAVSIIISYTQGKRERQAQKIDLFDKRYHIYCEFLKLYKYSKYVKQDPSDLNPKTDFLNYIEILDLITSEYRFLDGRSYLGEHNKLLNLIETTKGDERHQADLQFGYLDLNVQGKLDHLYESLVNEIQMGQFIFSEDVCAPMKLYVEEFYKYVGVFSKGSSQETVRDASKLLETIQQINKRKIIESMEKDLSYIKPLQRSKKDGKKN